MANPIFHSQYTAQQIEDLITNGAPIVGQNGHWWRWNVSTQQYEDTGVTADSETAATEAQEARDEAVALVSGKESIMLKAFASDGGTGATVGTAYGAEDVPLKQFVANITAIWGGSGEPAPDNIRPITGFTGVTITRVGDEDIEVSWEDAAGTVYGGTIDVLTGLLTVTHWGHVFDGTENLSLSGSELSVSWAIDDANKAKTSSEEPTQAKRLPYSSHYVVAGTGNYTRVSLSTSGGSVIFSYLDGYNVPINLGNFKTFLTTQYAAETPVTLVWVLGEQEQKTFQLAPVAVKSLLGANSLSASTGDISVTYACDPNLYVDAQINGAIVDAIGGAY